MATNLPLTEREVAMAQTIDLTESRRIHMFRMLTSNRDMLDDALAALRDGNLRTADEFVERFLSAVDKEIEYQKAR